MAEAVTEVVGIDEVLERLGDAASPATLVRGMRKATALVQREIAVYPPAQPQPMVWASERQRRFVMAAIREGRIQVPYRRTGTLGKRWTSEVAGEGADVVGRVGNNTTYGPFVMDKKLQAAYHQGVWPVAMDVVEEHRGEIVQCFVDVAQEGLAGKA